MSGPEELPPRDTPSRHLNYHAHPCTCAHPANAPVGRRVALREKQPVDRSTWPAHRAMKGRARAPHCSAAPGTPDTGVQLQGLHASRCVKRNTPSVAARHVLPRLPAVRAHLRCLLRCGFTRCSRPPSGARRACAAGWAPDAAVAMRAAEGVGCALRATAFPLHIIRFMTLCSSVCCVFRT